MSGSPTPAVSSPPLLGEHTTVVLEELGIVTADELATLRAAGVIADAAEPTHV
jgi:crotonobetainyl-CoA:carnitine CoA-transferase CaiB-like acyl-CoA transferase